MDRFFMCFVEGANQPTRRYEVKADAVAEAERLARTTGKPTYLLESVNVCSPKAAPVEWEIPLASEAWRTSPRMT